ncbi:MAG: ABC transporter permease [Candidatus Heimdallarchaeota archaeon]|nr:ABC transporter permease [Candidatus Heimdallarchaeota archaeon]
MALMGFFGTYVIFLVSIVTLFIYNYIRSKKRKTLLKFLRNFIQQNKLLIRIFLIVVIVNFALLTIFDFGDSIFSNADVGQELKLVFGQTLMLAVSASLIGIPLGIYLGGVAGANRGKTKDQIIRIFTIGIYATPIFLMGIILQIRLGEGGTLSEGTIPIFPPLGILSPGLTDDFNHYTEIWIIDALLSGKPSIALDILIHLVLPSFTLGMLIASSISRQVRTNMIHELEQEYVQFARARGISENKVIKRYALKNAVIPVIGLIGLQFALLLSGAILTETVYNIPGLGRYLFSAIVNRDFPAVQGAFVIFMFIVSIVSLLSDILYAILDPRIKF